MSTSDKIASVEVRFRNSGLDLIEVQDNGSGIAPENYENVGTGFATYA